MPPAIHFSRTSFTHGFLALPLQGNPQGLAAYLNGVRFNQPFGGTVNWDLIPDMAIDGMDPVGSNPIFGLNALVGVISNPRIFVISTVISDGAAAVVRFMST